TENEQLPFGRLDGPVTPSDIPTNEPRSVTTLFTKVAVDPPTGATYQVGDSLLLANASRTLEGYGHIVEPRGLARVIQVSDGTPIAEVGAVYGEILPGQAVMPAKKYTDPGLVQPVPVKDGVAASIIGWPGRPELQGFGLVPLLHQRQRGGGAQGLGHRALPRQRQARRRSSGRCLRSPSHSAPAPGRLGHDRRGDGDGSGCPRPRAHGHLPSARRPGAHPPAGHARLPGREAAVLTSVRPKRPRRRSLQGPGAARFSGLGSLTQFLLRQRFLYCEAIRV